MMWRSKIVIMCGGLGTTWMCGFIFIRERVWARGLWVKIMKSTVA